MAVAKQPKGQKQQSLLSFFRPESAAPSKRKIQPQEDLASPQENTLPPPARRHKTQHEQDAGNGRDKAAVEAAAPSDSMDQTEEPLFSPNFESDTLSNLPRNPVTSSLPLQQSTASATKHKGLALFEFNARDRVNKVEMDIDHDSQQERHERFVRKFGSQGQSNAPEIKASPLTRRQRLIVAESDEEEVQPTLPSDIDLPPPQPYAPKGAQPGKTSDLGGRAPVAKKSKSQYTPLEKQFVEIKEQYPDTILCVEVGYKFRFFGNDAEIASKELCIAHFMDHNFYTASIPTHRLDVHVRRLVHAGHKVGVVRQMETAALKSAGDNKSAPFTRKLTNLYTKATFLESLDQEEEQFQGSFVGKESNSQYIMCLYEEQQGGSGADEKVKLSMIAVQPATGDILYDEFQDGHFRNELETRLLHIQPAELLLPMASMSKATEKLLQHLTASSNRHSATMMKAQDDVRIERTKGFLKYDKAFSLVSEFYSTGLKEESLSTGGRGKDHGPGSGSKTTRQSLLKTVLELPSNLIITLGAIITHLTDFGLAPIFRLSKYFECFTSRSHMLLNGNTIANLEIYRNQTDGSSRGSLFSTLDRTVTGFGRRLLKKWVGKPLVNKEALQERVDAVEEILRQAGQNVFLQNTKAILKGIMDLEKGVCRIHYGKSSPKEFLAILETFKKISLANPVNHDAYPEQSFGLSSPMLIRLVGSLSMAAEDTQYFLQGLDDNAARKDDKLHMFREDLVKAHWPEIIEHNQNILETEEDLVSHLAEIRKLLREPRLEFASVSGIDYLIEIKNKDVAKVPKTWVKISGTKQVSRFHTPETIRLIQAKAQHQERLVLACDRAFNSFQQEFSERYEVFRDLVQNLAVLDSLFSLAAVACLPGYVKPEYVDDLIPASTSSLLGTTRPSSATTIDIQNGRHPMVEHLLPPGNFVPNHVDFGRRIVTREDGSLEHVDEKTLILTGPNMGGKSCYIRQVALLCIMAQIGSYLPADSARVSLLDAVYTRMGASDNIFGHESTFMVELQEASDILKMATPRSLVILDELGRGTSTLDGVAIAYAVLKHCVAHLGATTLFVTHYPSLAEVAKEFTKGRIRNFHMGFMAKSSSLATDGSEMELDEVPGTTKETDEMDIVFLYKLMPGVSMKSYGLNVARMAKLPKKVIDQARIKSKDLERILEQRAEKRSTLHTADKLKATLGRILHCRSSALAVGLLDDLQSMQSS